MFHRVVALERWLPSAERAMIPGTSRGVRAGIRRVDDETGPRRPGEAQKEATWAS